jgi:uncharacterized protein DUF6152
MGHRPTGPQKAGAAAWKCCKIVVERLLMNRSLIFAACLAIGGSVPLFAHHSFAAEFDDTKPVKMTGTITKVEWMNPHIWFYLDVKNPS